MREARDRFPVVVHVLVRRGGTVALLRRADTGFMDGYYTPPGGHQQQGEGVADAARRECREELGIEVLDLEPACVLPYRSGRHQGLNFVFVSTQHRGTARINEPALFDALVWAEPGALPEPVPEWITVALDLMDDGGWYRELEWD